MLPMNRKIKIMTHPVIFTILDLKQETNIFIFLQRNTNRKNVKSHFTKVIEVLVSRINNCIN